MDNNEFNYVLCKILSVLINEWLLLVYETIEYNIWLFCASSPNPIRLPPHLLPLNFPLVHLGNQKAHQAA